MINQIIGLDRNKWNHLIVWKRMNSVSFKNVIYKMCLEIVYLIYMYKKHLALNNLQWLIWYKTKPNLLVKLSFVEMK